MEMFTVSPISSKYLDFLTVLAESGEIAKLSGLAFMLYHETKAYQAWLKRLMGGDIEC